MTRILFTLIAVFGLGGSALLADGSFDVFQAPSGWKRTVQDLRPQLNRFSSEFQRERGVSWDGRIAWKTPERVWVFAAALERSLKEVIRPDSPFRLSVTVIRAEKGNGTFVVEFSILDASGESVESVQVEGVGPSDRSSDEVYPALAGKIVTTFKKSVL